MHTRHFPSFLRTTTIFANQSGYFTSLINPASNNLSISSRIIFCLFGWKLLTLCRTGLAEGRTLSLWEAIEGCIPFMSECAHAKMSWLCRRVSWMSCAWRAVRSELTCVRWVLSSEIWIVRKGSAARGSLSVGFSNCYWPGAPVGSGRGSPSLLVPTSRAIW